jgi:hypothetical protein
MSLLFEHKSYPEPFIALAPLRYMLRIWEQWRKEDHTGRLPPIFPLVIYHGRQPWRVATDFAALIEAPEAFIPFVPDFQYLLTDLSRYRDDEIRGAVMVCAALLVLKYHQRRAARAPANDSSASGRAGAQTHGPGIPGDGVALYRPGGRGTRPGRVAPGRSSGIDRRR